MPTVTGLLDQGRAGVARIPGKHGGQQRNFTVVQVVIADQPGELARLFNAAGAAGVNIEDIRIEHSPGLPVGVAELSVRPDQAGHAARRDGGRRLAGSSLMEFAVRGECAKLDGMTESAKPAAPKADAAEADTGPAAAADDGDEATPDAGEAKSGPRRGEA